MLTDYKADNYRVIKIKLSDPAPEHWTTIVPEGKDVIESISVVGGKLFVTGLHDVITQTRDLHPGWKGRREDNVSDAGSGVGNVRTADVEARFL